MACYPHIQVPGAIFGATGGVMEAALRTVSEILDKKRNTN